MNNKTGIRNMFRNQVLIRTITRRACQPAFSTSNKNVSFDRQGEPFNDQVDEDQVDEEQVDEDAPLEVIQTASTWTIMATILTMFDN